MKNNILIIFICAFCVFFPACNSLANALSLGAQSGGLDENTANAFNNASKALSSAAEDINPEQEYYIGRAVAANILGSYMLYEGNPLLTAYVNKICNSIVINSPKPDIYNGYYVMLLDSEEINAFATSGGHIFISRGLISSAKSEDALAGVIAHEIAHIQLQHSIKAIKTSRITQALLVTGTSAVGAASGLDVNELTDIFNESVGQIVTTMVNNGYSQSQEFDADNTAMGLLAATGYNPSGLIDMLKELSKTQAAHSGGFNKTHPTPEKRIQSAQKALKKYKVNDTSAYRLPRFSEFG
ncbi:MAG: M48 family metalloprotease [Treponema sp.]|nr:M48 family metalloprotease [Treponema sp.]